MSIHQSSSAGVLGWFVRRLAREGLVSPMFANSSKAVAAHGGKVPFFGTNPFAMGAPRAGDHHGIPLYVCVLRVGLQGARSAVKDDDAYCTPKSRPASSHHLPGAPVGEYNRA